jgi:hypothetical protein
LCHNVFHKIDFKIIFRTVPFWSCHFRSGFPSKICILPILNALPFPSCLPWFQHSNIICQGYTQRNVFSFYTAMLTMLAIYLDTRSILCNVPV